MTALRKLQRDLWIASRTVGDVDAARRGVLAQRLARRQATRTFFSLLRKGTR